MPGAGAPSPSSGTAGRPRWRTGSTRSWRRGEACSPPRRPLRRLPADAAGACARRHPRPGSLPTPGDAHGLAFSVARGTPVPRSLANIFREMRDDIGAAPVSGNLSGWARQGVLLLNTVLTVEAGAGGQPSPLGWQAGADRRGDPRRVGAGGADRVRALGRRCAGEAAADRSNPASRHRERASLAAVGEARVLRFAALQPGERLPARARAGRNRLDISLTFVSRPSPARRRARGHRGPSRPG